MFDSNFDDLIARSKEIPIEDVIGTYIDLKRVGANYQGICPFHDDTKPSLSISPSKNIFKCFACGKSGDVLSFVQEYKSIHVIAALEEITGEKFLSSNKKKKLPKTCTTPLVEIKAVELCQKHDPILFECLFSEMPNAKTVLSYLINYDYDALVKWKNDISYQSADKTIASSLHFMKTLNRIKDE